MQEDYRDVKQPQSDATWLLREKKDHKETQNNYRDTNAYKKMQKGHWGVKEPQRNTKWPQKRPNLHICKADNVRIFIYNYTPGQAMNYKFTNQLTTNT